AGIGSMTIVDGDDVHISNLNRQLLALNSNMGRPKAEVMAERLLDINPSLKIEVINEFLRDERTQEVLDKGFDYVVDAIDTLSPKVFLIYHAVQRHIPVVSSMGSGGKMDPEQVSIDDISKTTNCHLARMLRKRLHRLGITTGVKAVYSTEPVDKSRIVNVDDEQNKVSAVGTISYMPALFGMTCASVVIRDLLAKE
ncbi:MAG: tRNA threonylcarbamoyladenosine dehydratase, partial [Bacteroidales bacterium]|nr:tRNA threonylcarbamoyladenosine dehydratase [Bacteroidales bacterium]